jgi:hypothetical protein
VSIHPERTRAIREFPTPRDVRSISCFIGMVNFYHKFIPWVADVVALLNSLHKKGVRIRTGSVDVHYFYASPQGGHKRLVSSTCVASEAWK